VYTPFYTVFYFATGVYLPLTFQNCKKCQPQEKTQKIGNRNKKNLSPMVLPFVKKRIKQR
jgi:hypothetical protein